MTISRYFSHHCNRVNASWRKVASMGWVALGLFAGCQSDRLTPHMESISETYEKEWQRSQAKRTDYLCQLVDDTLSENFPHLAPYEGDYVLGTYGSHFVIAGAAFTNGYNRKYNSIKNVFIGHNDSFRVHPAFFSSDIKIYDKRKARSILAEGKANRIALEGEVCSLTTSWGVRGKNQSINLRYQVNITRPALQVSTRGHSSLRLQYLYKIQNEAFLINRQRKILPAGRLYAYQHKQDAVFTKIAPDRRVAQTGGKYGFSLVASSARQSVVAVFPNRASVNQGFFDPIGQAGRKGNYPTSEVHIANSQYKNTLFYNTPFEKTVFARNKPVAVLFGRYNQTQAIQLPRRGPYTISIVEDGKVQRRLLKPKLNNTYQEGKPTPLIYTKMATDKSNFPAGWRTRVTRVSYKGQLVGETREIPTSLNHSFVLDRGNFYISVLNEAGDPICQFYLKNFRKENIRLNCSTLNNPPKPLENDPAAKSNVQPPNKWRKVSKDSLFSLSYDRRKYPQQDVAFMDFDQLATVNRYRHQQPLPLDLSCESPSDSLLPLLDRLEQIKPKTVNIDNCFLNPRAVAYQVELHKIANLRKSATPYVSESYKVEKNKPLFWQVSLDKMDETQLDGSAAGSKLAPRPTELKLEAHSHDNVISFKASTIDPKTVHKSIKLYINDRAFEAKNANTFKLALPLSSLPKKSGVILRLTTVTAQTTEFQRSHKIASDDFHYYISRPFQINITP